MKVLIKRANFSILFWIVVFLLPLLFFLVISLFHIEGLTAYFIQLSLYALFFVLAFWAQKRDGITYRYSVKKILLTAGFLAISWLIYLLVLRLTGWADLKDEFQTLLGIPAWKIWANVLSTWFFVGIAEELLFRGYMMVLIKRFLENKQAKRVTLGAILLSSLAFSLWHIPVRIYEVVNGESSLALVLLSILVLFVIGIGFAWLFIRSGNILLVGLVHGVMDYPLLGKDSQMSFIIVIAAIIIVEIDHLLKHNKPRMQTKEDVE